MEPATRHVLIYGPPAAGKLTVGRILASQTGFRLLDNHLSIDVVRHLFDFGAPGFWATVGDIRIAMVSRAAEHGADIISTYVWSPLENRRYIDAVHDAVTSAGGTTLRVQLRPSVDVLAARAVEPSRLPAGKLADPDEVRRQVERWDLYTPIDPADLSIDNSALAPEAVAGQIRSHFGLGGPFRPSMG